MTWKLIVNFETYEVSECGEVRNRVHGHTLAPGLATSGYLTVALGRGNTRTIHSLVANTFLERTGPVINHIDGNKLNNHISNLEFTTYQANNAHAVAYKLNTHRRYMILPTERELILELEGVMKAPDVAVMFGFGTQVIYKLWSKNRREIQARCNGTGF